MKKGLYTLFLLLGIIVDAFSQTMLISGGNDHGVALCNKGQIFAWGNNNGNRLGLKPPYDAQTVVNKPQEVNIPVGLTFSQVSAGSGSHNVALSCKKIVYGWGENKQYQAGQPTGDVVDRPMPVLCGEATNHGYAEDGVTPGEYLGDVKKIAATTAASLALLDDGTAVMWGGNGRYQGSPTSPLFKVESHKPIYIRDENNKILQNIIDISGGDNNLTIIVGSSPSDVTGTVYSVGNWNGRGGDGATPGTDCFVAKPVIIADPNDGGKASTGKKTLNAVKTSGIADAGGFAFDENEGFLYSWGNNGWGGMVGSEKQGTYTYAWKVIAGEYSKISNEAFMTNVHQVIGGNGYGALVTEDGYLLYMGNNNTTGRDGGIIPNSEWANAEKCKNGTVVEPGPIFATYCKGEKDPTKEVIVDDAAAIGRGDLFGFMVNKDGDFYVWGNTKCPGNDEPAEVGTLGLGFNGKADDPEGKGYRTCLSKIELACDPQDECPKVYMIGPRYKCPGETDSLYCGFTPTTRSVGSYFFRWSLDGTVLNTSTLNDAQDAANGNSAAKTKVKDDVWNNWTVEIKDPGKYSVEIFYVGNNVPCTNCETAEGEIEVIDMDMPIDIDTLESCVLDTLKPSSSDKIEFQAKVNNKFYNATDNVTFAVFATPTSTDTLKDIDGNSIIINTTGNGGDINFKVFGDKIDRSLGVEPRPGIDTLYHVWIEDITKFNTQLIDQTNSKSTNNGERCLILKLFSTSELTSFSVYAEGNTNNEATITITPVVYMAGKVKDGNYTLGAPLWTGDAQPFTIEKGENDGGTQITKKIECVVKCGVQLPGNPARGTEYVLSAIIKFRENGNYFLNTLPAATNMYFGTPIDDSKGYGVQAVGTFAANGTGGGYSNTDGVPFYNINFGKMTDYDCGRIPLSARFYCPPCNNPDKLEIVSTSHTIRSNVDPKYKKVVELCKESDPLDLDIEPLVGQTDPTATFDILWYDEDPQKNAAATALKKDETGTVNTLLFSTDWATVAGATDITEDAEKVYYVYVHDHEKVGCPNYDSIKVIAHPVPVDSLAWDTFCLTNPLAGPTSTIPTGKKADNWNPADPTTVDWSTIKETTSFTYTITDDLTKCVSEPHTYTVTVNSTDEPDVDEAPSTTVDATGVYPLSLAVKTPAPTGFEIRWYDENKTLLSSKDIPRNTAGQYTFWAEMYNTETDCASEKVEVTLTISDALAPITTNEHLCIGDKIPDISEYVEKQLKLGETDTDYELLWYTEAEKNAEKGTGKKTSEFQTIFEATASSAETTKFYVSQKSTTAPFAESEKSELIITVHKVATLDLSGNKTEYCIDDATVDVLTAQSNADGDFSTAKWSKSKNGNKLGGTPAESLTPLMEKGKTTYYVLPEFTNSGKKKSYASDVCYGTIQDIDINVNFVNVPNADEPNIEISYLMSQGQSAGRYNDLQTQSSNAIKTDDDTKYELVWYNENKTESSVVPEPPYDPLQPTSTTYDYYVAQQMKDAPYCKSELKKVTAVISSTPQPIPVPLSFCQGKEHGKLDAKINTLNGMLDANNYELLWYIKDPDKVSGQIPRSELYVTDLDLTYDYMNEKEHDVTAYVRQKEKGPGGDESPTAKLTISIYSNPILKVDASHPIDPICLGDSVNLEGYYMVSNKVGELTYETDYLDGNDPLLGQYVKKHGKYKTRQYFKLSNGDICKSDLKEIDVTVNELSVDIDGDIYTCPNTGKEMKAVVTSKNMLSTDSPTYSWNIAPTGKRFSTETINTTGDGLVNNSDKLTIDLKVEMGACKVSASKTLTVKDPGVNGNITFDEEDNTNSGLGGRPLYKDRIVEFDGCNKKVDVVFEVDQTEDEFTYKKIKDSEGNVSTDPEESGTFVSKKGTLRIEPGLYEVSYINTCNQSFQFNIINKALNVKLKSSDPEVCEGQPLELNIINEDKTPFVFNPSIHKKIEWKKEYNNVTTDLTSFNNQTTMLIPQSTPNDNGDYSVKIQVSGCTTTMSNSRSGGFRSLPKVKVDKTLLEDNGNYEVIRTKDKAINISLLNPTNASDLTKLESNTKDGVIWSENGVKVNTGFNYDLKNVVEDHTYTVIIANGEGGRNDDFCGTDLKINVKVDALLAIKTSMVDESGNVVTDMCVNQTGTGILIDTTGTGIPLHKDASHFTFKVIETIDSNTKEIAMRPKGNKLFAEINPTKDATYDIVYKYTVGSQDSSKTEKIKVHPAYEVDWDQNVRLCDGESGKIDITRKYPNDITLTWEPDPCLKNKGDETGVDVIAIFSGEGLKETKKLTLIASNNGICADKKFYPSFIIDKSIEGEILAPEFICENHQATLNAKYDATEYVWSSENQLGENVTLNGAVVNVTPKGTFADYTVTMKRGACKHSDEVNLEVREAPKFDRIDSLTYKSIEIILQANTGSEPFQYIIDDKPDEFVLQNIKEGLDYGEHKVSVVDDARCRIDTIVYVNNPGVEIPIVVSPNGDKINDAFIVPNLREAYPDAKIRIYDRWGKKLTEYRAGDEGMDWDGTYNGVAMPTTDYWYEIEIKEIHKTYTGHFTLIRQ